MIRLFVHKGMEVSMLTLDPVMVEEYDQGRFYERHMLDWMDVNIPKGGTWVDVGANCGNHTVFFGMFCADKVVSIEPVITNFETLAANVKQNMEHKTYHLIYAGAGDAKGQMRYSTPTGKTRWSQVQLSEEGEKVAAIITIDSLNLKDVRVMKFDCEGMEGKAVKGSLKTIERWKPELFIEIWEDEELERFEKELATFGYRMVERYGHAPTYHFTTNAKYPRTYTKP